MIASALAALLVASGAGAHGGPMTADEHAAEDSVVHTGAQEQALDAHTRTVSAPFAQAAAAAATGAPQDVGEWGPIVDWPVVGVHVALRRQCSPRLDRRQCDGDISRAGILSQPWDPRDGSQTPVDDGLQHLLQRAGLLDGRPVRRREQDQQLNGSCKRTCSIRRRLGVSARTWPPAGIKQSRR
jgi:hypothetical protein